MSRLSLLGIEQIILDGQTISYTVKRSLRSRYVRLEIHLESGLTVVIPKRFSSDNIPKFLHEKKPWIKRKLKDCQNYQAKARDKNSIKYLGRIYKIIEIYNHNNHYSVGLEQNRIIVRFKKNSDTKNILETWFRNEAKKLLTAKTAAFSQIIDVRFRRFTIRHARTRWGSCSKLGNLNFNWKLLKAPEAVIDYVIIHELCHLKEMNHSSEFWRLVGKYCPDYAEQKKWLREHEDELTGN